jgi:hypothetical protein
MRDGTSRKCLIAGAVAGCLLLVGCGGGGGSSETAATTDVIGQVPVTDQIEVRIVRNGALQPILPVRFQPLDAPRLDELRTREQLDDVVADGHDEFSRILLLKNWVAAQFPHSIPDPYPPWDAMIVLDWIRAGITGGFCGQYSQVLLQSLASLGITARYVEIGTTDNPYAHFVVEVWSDEFGKWVVMDADYNIHYEDADGVPLSALEIHDALIQQRTQQLVVVEGSVREGHDTPSRWPLRTAELYYYYRVHLKANHLSVPDEPPFDRFNDMIEWHDAATVPWESSTVPSSYPKERLTNLVSGDRAAFTNGPNRVEVSIGSVSADEVVLRFANNMLQLDHYQVRAPGEEWQDSAASSYSWRPTRESDELQVRGVNIRGVEGQASVVRAEFRPQ